MYSIFTIGYEGTDIDRFIATLHAVGIEVLVDVRALALSRKKGFSKKVLSEKLSSESIEYHHFSRLGDPKTGRDAARAGRYDEFERIYRTHLGSDEAQISLDNLSQLLMARPCCLMCFERDPRFCHRSIIAETYTDRGMEVLDLYGDFPGRYDNFLISSRNSRKGLAAAE